MSPAAGEMAAASRTAAARVRVIADDYVRAYVARHPERASDFGFPPRRVDHLPDNSIATARGWQQKEDVWIRQLDSISADILWGTPEWVTHGMLSEHLVAARGTRICERQLWSVSQLGGWQVGFPAAIQNASVQSASDRELLLTKWADLPRYLTTETENLRTGLRRGFSTPKGNVQLVIDQIDRILAQPADHSALYAPIRRDTSASFRAQWTTLLHQRVVPSIRAFRDFLVTEYLPAARSAVGVSANPNGAECYRALIRSYTGTARDAAEVAALGRERVETNMREAAAIAARDFGTSDLAAARRIATEDSSARFRTRDDVLNFYREVHNRAMREAPRWFNRLPKADVVVEGHPPHLDRTAGGSYNAAPPNSGRPAVVKFNLSRPEERTRFQAEIAMIHEGVPGHHLQVGLARELPAAHPVTQLLNNSGFGEGWARYAEALAEEMGLYHAPYATVQRRIWPGRGMVFDPGIHVLGWTREQALEFMMAGGNSRASAETLLDRAVVTPGQLTSYDLGAHDFFELRRQAETTLGDRFDIREFHDRLLEHGTITLPMLRSVVQRWLADRQHGGR